MKIGILTYHFSINCGAVLQCYGLQKYLEEKGYNVEVIDYVSDNQEDNTRLYRKKITLSNILKNILLILFHKSRAARNYRFDLFRSEYLRTSKRIKNITELNQYIHDNCITHMIVGSDQVWNPGIKDFDEVYFLMTTNRINKIGYAISLGEAKGDDILKYKNAILDFDAVSMREKTGIKIIESITGRKPSICVDPTFLLDNKIWKGLINGINRKPYVLCYFLNQKKYRRNYSVAKKFAQEKGLDIITIDFRIDINVLFHKTILDCGPKEFLSLLNNATYVFTDSFHGTVFSVIFGKRFISYNNGGERIDTRRIEFLKQIGMQAHYLTIEEFFYSKNIIEDISSNCLEKISISSKQFLERVLI